MNHTPESGLQTSYDILTCENNMLRKELEQARNQAAVYGALSGLLIDAFGRMSVFDSHLLGRVSPEYPLGAYVRAGDYQFISDLLNFGPAKMLAAKLKASTAVIQAVEEFVAVEEESKEFERLIMETDDENLPEGWTDRRGELLAWHSDARKALGEALEVYEAGAAVGSGEVKTYEEYLNKHFPDWRETMGCLK